MHSRIDSLFSTLLLILAFTAIYAAMPRKTASASSVERPRAAAQTQDVDAAR